MMTSELPNTNHRRAHHDDGERARIDRLAREAEVRIGGVRVPAEPPAPQDVDRFRTLFAARGNETPRAMPQKEAPPRDSETTTARADAPAPDEPQTQQPRAEASPLRAKPENQGRGEGVHGDTAQDEAHSRENAAAPTERRDTRAVDSDGAPTRPTVPSGKADAAAQDDALPRGDKTAHAEGASAKASERHALHGDTEVAAAISGSASEKKASSDAADDTETSAAPNAATPAQVSAEAASFVQAHRFTMEAPQQAATAAATAAPALAELIEKHVKQMLVSDTPASKLHAREVLLQMHGDVLPGTDLWLTRTANGWRLRADVRSRDAYDALVAGSEDLIQRFADGALGELTIEPVFHGAAPISGTPTAQRT